MKTKEAEKDGTGERKKQNKTREKCFSLGGVRRPTGLSANQTGSVYHCARPAGWLTAAARLSRQNA